MEAFEKQFGQTVQQSQAVFRFKKQLTGFRFCKDKSTKIPGDDNGEQNTAFTKGNGTRAAVSEKSLEVETSQHIEEPEQDTEEDAVEKIRKSGLSIKPIVRKALNCHSFQFLCWLPEALKDSDKKNSDGGLTTNTNKEDEEQGSGNGGEKGGEEQAENDFRDEGVCIMKVVRRKPNQDKDKSTSKDEGRQLYELTLSEWKVIQDLRKAAEIGDEQDSKEGSSTQSTK